MKSLTKTLKVPEDGPEEGEIVSDDLEDISDESIIFTLNNGKSLSRSDHLRALSLSSVTDLDEPPVEKRQKRRKPYTQRHTRRRKRSCRKTVDTDSSDNDTSVDRRLKLQLKAAVRVNVEEAHRNSLRTRLRAMVKNGSGAETEIAEPEKQIIQQISPNDNVLDTDQPVDLPVVIIDLVENDTIDTTGSCMEILASGSENAPSGPENNESASKQYKGEAIDNELIQLRIEALKTAIDNKFANRIKRKKENADDTNKENTSNNSEENLSNNTPVSEIRLEIPKISPQTSNEFESNVPPSPDEDEDVLRALLLASMSKKITRARPEPLKFSFNKAQAKMAIINKMKTNNFKLNNNVRSAINNVKKVVNRASGATKLIKMPQVKPLIINLNSDSDSDWEFNSSPEKSPKKVSKDSTKGPIANKLVKQLKTVSLEVNKVNNAIESTVERFLQEQRAKVESEVPSVNTDVAMQIAKTNEMKTAIVLPGTTSKLKAQVAPKATPEKVKRVPILEKSALKFLPASKREEYKKLQNLLMLKKAQMKKANRVRRTNHKVALINKNEGLSLTNSGPSITKKSTKTSTGLEAAKSKNNFFLKGVNESQNNVTVQFKNTTSTLTNNPPPVLPSQSKQNAASLLVKKIVHSRSTQTTSSETNHVQLLPKVEARLKEFRHQELQAAKWEEERKKESMVLRTTLRQLQSKTDGRLQIQEKYKSLRPLVKKLNEVSKQQKHWDQEVERLITELAKAREKQGNMHRNMSACVKEFVEEKKKIDSSFSKVISKTKPPNILITSTPIKPTAKTSPLIIGSSFTSTLSNSATDTKDIIPDQSQTTMGQSLEETLIEKTYKSKEVESKNRVNTLEQSTIYNYQTEAEISVVDPNDIDNIIKKIEKQVAQLKEEEGVKCGKPKKDRYVSPLDAGQRRNVLDPFGIMCPFEVNGTCKDPDCAYNHLPK